MNPCPLQNTHTHTQSSEQASERRKTFSHARLLMAGVPVGTAQVAPLLLRGKATRVKDTELSDKAEPAAGMLTES